MKQMSKQTPQRAPVVEISGMNCSSGSGSGPVTTQRVTGRTDRRELGDLRNEGSELQGRKSPSSARKRT